MWNIHQSIHELNGISFILIWFEVFCVNYRSWTVLLFVCLFGQMWILHLSSQILKQCYDFSLRKMYRIFQCNCESLGCILFFVLLLICFIVRFVSNIWYVWAFMCVCAMRADFHSHRFGLELYPKEILYFSLGTDVFGFFVVVVVIVVAGCVATFSTWFLSFCLFYFQCVLGSMCAIH